MEANENKVTRKGSTPIKVYCLPDERAAIEANAQAADAATGRALVESAGRSLAQLLQELSQLPLSTLLDRPDLTP